MPSEAIQMERISPGRSTDGDTSDTDCHDHWQSSRDSHHHTSPHSMVSTADEENSNEQLLNLTTTSHKRTSEEAELESRLHPAADVLRHADINTSTSTTHCSSEPRVRTQPGTDRSDSASSRSDVDEKPDIARTIKYPIASHYQAMLLASSSVSTSGLQTQIPFPFFPLNTMPQHPISSNVRPNSFAHSNALSNYLYPQFNPSHSLTGVAATTGPTPVGLHQQTSFPSFLCPPGFGMPPAIDSSMLSMTSKRRRIIKRPSKTESPEQDSSSISQCWNPQPSTSSGLPVGDLQSRDEAYAERRRKNNEAAKRSRDLRRMKEQETALQARQLYEENIRLKVELQYLAQQLALLRNGYGGR